MRSTSIYPTFRMDCMVIPSTRARIWQIEIGDPIGISEWLTVTQQMICEFGATTRDPDPMHLDAAWAAQNGPFGGAIAYGFLTVSLLTTLFNSAVGDPTARERHADGSYLNYGLDRVRLVAPVPAGARWGGPFFHCRPPPRCTRPIYYDGGFFSRDHGPRSAGVGRSMAVYVDSAADLTG